jgi:hypothetical protein
MKFGNFEKDDSIVDDTRDASPVKRNWIKDAGVYPAVIDLAYTKYGQNGAKLLVVHFKEDIPEGAVTIRHTYVCTKNNGDRFIYSNGQKRYLRGWSEAEHLCQLSAKKGLLDVEFEEKTIELYDFDAGSNMPTKVPVCMDLLGKKVQIAIKKIRKNKRRKEGADWIETSDEKLSNELVKVFDTSGRTFHEAKGGMPPTWREQWVKENAGKLEDYYNPIGAPPAAKTPDDIPFPAADDKSTTKKLF